MSTRVHKGFTLVEILIVVVILGILASVVVPQFTNASTEAMAGNLKSQLRSLQNQIDLYMSRNNGTHPITTMSQSWAALTGGGYLKADPVNPAYPKQASAPTTVCAQSATGVRGAAGWAWVWNSTDLVVAASYFNEATGQVTSSASD